MDLTSGHHTGPTTSFIFPVLKSGEILQTMAELGMELTKPELTDPNQHKSKVRKVLLHLLEHCCGLSEEDFSASPSMLQQASELTHGELHQEFSELAFFQALRECLSTCGYTDFSWRDLYAPTSKRLRHQLSAIINLAKFREEQIKVYGELNEPRTQVLAALEEVNLENAQLTEQLQATTAVSQASLEEMDQVVQECQELELEIARNNKLQAAAREEADSLKRRANELQDELQTAQWELQEAESKEERLRGQVVSSPDRRKAQVLMQRERLDHEKQALQDMQTSLQECKTKVLHANQATKELDAVCVTLDELSEECLKYQHLLEQQEEALRTISAHEKKTHNVTEDMQEAERSLHRTEEKTAHQRKQHQMQMQATQEALEMLKSQLLAVEKDRRDGMARVDAGEQEVRALEAAIEAERHKTAHEIHDMIAEYRETEQLFLERNQQRMKAIGAV